MYCHRRQFLIGPRPVMPTATWKTMRIPNAGYLSYCPELRVAATQGVDGQMWYLLGLAVQTDPQKPSPIDAIAQATRTTIQDVYQSWAGRWLLIGDNKVYMDASGLLGCFYIQAPAQDSTQELWVSSSAALLLEITGADATPVRSITHGKGIDWYPGPHSRYRSIRRLLPSQILVLTTGAQLLRSLLPVLTECLSYDDVLDILQDYLIRTLQQAANVANTLWLPLTAGYDSRLLLATAHYAHIPVQTFTHIHEQLFEADRLLPPRLAAAVGVEHTCFTGGPLNAAVEALYDKHTAGHCVDRDRFYVAHDYFNWSRKGDLILRGGVFDLGHHRTGKRFPGATTDSTVLNAEDIAQGYKEVPQPALVEPLREWVAWTEETPHAHLNWLDRLYLEQRLGGWLSSVEQSLDLIDAERFYAANSHMFFAYVLQVPYAKRRVAQHHVDLIQRMAPELLQVPFNPRPPKSVPQRITKEIKEALGKAKRYVKTRAQHIV